MPSTYTASARFVLQASGENTNTWGIILNQGAFALIDTAINGRTAFALSGTKTLTTANGAADEARASILDITSGTGGTVTIPAVTKTYLVRNAATGSVIVTTGSGRSATIAPPASGATAYAVVLCDATNVDRHPNQTEIDSALTAAKSYADGLSTASGNLPNVSGNAGRFLTNDGSTAYWAAGGVLMPSNNLSDVVSASASRSNLGLGFLSTVTTAPAGRSALAVGQSKVGGATGSGSSVAITLPTATSARVVLRKLLASSDGSNLYIQGITSAGTVTSASAYLTAYWVVDSAGNSGARYGGGSFSQPTSNDLGTSASNQLTLTITVENLSATSARLLVSCSYATNIGRLTSVVGSCLIGTSGNPLTGLLIGVSAGTMAYDYVTYGDE